MRGTRAIILATRMGKHQDRTVDMRQSTPAEKSGLGARALVALGCAVGIVVLMSAVSARAAEDDDPSFEDKFIGGFLKSIGLQKDEPGINYQERAPLVIPPSRDLPTPESDAAARNPNWPVDPEVKRQKQIKAAARARVHYGDEMDRDARPLRPDELAKGPRTSSTYDTGAMTADQSGRPLKPGELGYKGGLWEKMFGKDEESARFVGEPPRAALTDPPTGYQTPSPNQPYGKGSEDRKPKAFNYDLDRATQNN